tara:strand:- start:63 stop:407 length:345 start_codon:yes stop_codon:yes gene_type:complete
MKITKQQLKQIIKEEISKVLSEQQESPEESIYNKYWKAAVGDLYPDQANEYYEDYDPESEERLVSKRVGFAYSRIRHAMGQYGGTPVTSDQEIIKAIQDGWEEGEEEYYDSEEY